MPHALTPALPLVGPAAPRPRRRPWGPTAAIAGMALALAGCVAPVEQTTPDPESTPEGTAAPALGTVEEYYGQEVAWSECGELECATVQAPLDWEDLDAGGIELALSRSATTGSTEQRLGSLLINPGGPGSSGAGFVGYATEIFSDRLLEAYDVVGFDPRGVGDSTAVSCGDDATVDAFLLADPPLDTQEDLDTARETLRAFGEGCLQQTGPLLENVDTVSAARDLDLLRGVLGDEKLAYAGFSYGTFLGATYADLFPENVGRLLLDGALDPSTSNDELVIGQAVGFEAALTAYVEDCQAGAECPLTGSVEDGKAQIAELLDRIERRPLETAYGVELDAVLGFYGVVVTLYNDEYWPLLTMALTEAMTENTGTYFVDLANAYLDRTVEGEYQSNQMVAFNAINCLDYPVVSRNLAELEAFADEVAAQAPTFGRDFALGIGCESWPVAPVGERGPIAAEGAPPILVVGTTGDPATPYVWSEALAEQLESGVLVTWEGEGHTAYGRANQCLTDAVDDYLVDGELPADGLVC
ncbi:alpha/beta hydrolase [Actinotalea sp. C106]|uniref:alpha/beta hydrolase n=1 Tax=Actinotalea sp. C106 TaxID=2908644 RepID=UPI002028571B|nr:alpha/beta hydrolase [Actinotalea sp. C106]